MSTIFVVEDEYVARMALSRLLAAASYEVRSFESAESFLKPALWGWFQPWIQLLPHMVFPL